MQADTFDFYNTLAYHKSGKGRGHEFQKYLASCGLSSAPWEHRVLYDVFDDFGTSYDPGFSVGAEADFWRDFTRRLFVRAGVRTRNLDSHWVAIREIMGPTCLGVFDDVVPALEALRARGIRMAVVSDWQKGLSHFCEELGLSGYFEAIVASAEAGYEKPDPRLFAISRERLGIPAAEILHLGDSAVDVQGATAAGFASALLAREGRPAPDGVRVIASLKELVG